MDELPKLVCLYCAMVQSPPLPTCQPSKTPTTHNNGQIKPVEADDKAVSSTALSSTVAPPFSASTALVSSYGTSPKGAKGGLSSTGSIAGPHVTRSPTSSI